MKNPKPALSTRSILAHPSRGSWVANSTRVNQSSRAPVNTSAYSASLDPKWWRTLGRRMPTAAAMSLSDVPSNPCSAKQRSASVRIASRVETGVWATTTSLGYRSAGPAVTSS